MRKSSKHQRIHGGPVGRSIQKVRRGIKSGGSIKTNETGRALGTNQLRIQQEKNEGTPSILLQLGKFLDAAFRFDGIDMLGTIATCAEDTSKFTKNTFACDEIVDVASGKFQESPPKETDEFRHWVPDIIIHVKGEDDVSHDLTWDGSYTMGDPNLLEIERSGKRIYRRKSKYPNTLEEPLLPDHGPRGQSSPREAYHQLTAQDRKSHIDVDTRENAGIPANPIHMEVGFPGRTPPSSPRKRVSSPRPEGGRSPSKGMHTYEMPLIDSSSKSYHERRRSPVSHRESSNHSRRSVSSKKTQSPTERTRSRHSVQDSGSAHSQRSRSPRSMRSPSEGARSRQSMAGQPTASRRRSVSKGRSVSRSRNRSPGIVVDAKSPKSQGKSRSPMRRRSPSAERGLSPASRTSAGDRSSLSRRHSPMKIRSPSCGRGRSSGRSRARSPPNSHHARSVSRDPSVSKRSAATRRAPSPRSSAHERSAISPSAGTAHSRTDASAYQRDAVHQRLRDGNISAHSKNSQSGVPNLGAEQREPNHTDGPEHQRSDTSIVPTQNRRHSVSDNVGNVSKPSVASEDNMKSSKPSEASEGNLNPSRINPTTANPENKLVTSVPDQIDIEPVPVSKPKVHSKANKEDKIGSRNSKQRSRGFFRKSREGAAKRQSPPAKSAPLPQDIGKHSNDSNKVAQDVGPSDANKFPKAFRQDAPLGLAILGNISDSDSDIDGCRIELGNTTDGSGSTTEAEKTLNTDEAQESTRRLFRVFSKDSLTGNLRRSKFFSRRRKSKKATRQSLEARQPTEDTT